MPAGKYPTDDVSGERRVVTQHSSAAEPMFGNRFLSSGTQIPHFSEQAPEGMINVSLQVAGWLFVFLIAWSFARHRE